MIERENSMVDRIIREMKDEESHFMDNLPKDLRDEYEYLIKNNKDVDGIEHPLINISDTLKAYFILAHYFTDPSSEFQEKMLIGVRDFNLLGSAIGRQTISFGGKVKYTDKIEICATLFFGLVKNHSFSDGNKRTALLILLYQLDLFGYIPIAPQKDFEKLVVTVAANKIPIIYKNVYKKCIKFDDPIVMSIAKIIRKMVKKKDHTYHINPTMKEVCDTLERCGVTYKMIGTKIHFERNIRKSWLSREQSYQYVASFSGWTRSVGADTARKILSSLDLYNEFVSYRDFIEGKEAMYQLVDTFNGPLRRLKDK